MRTTESASQKVNKIVKFSDDKSTTTINRTKSPSRPIIKSASIVCEITKDPNVIGIRRDRSLSRQRNDDKEKIVKDIVLDIERTASELSLLAGERNSFRRNDSHRRSSSLGIDTKSSTFKKSSNVDDRYVNLAELKIKTDRHNRATSVSPVRNLFPYYVTIENKSNDLTRNRARRDSFDSKRRLFEHLSSQENLSTNDCQSSRRRPRSCSRDKSVESEKRASSVVSSRRASRESLNELERDKKSFERTTNSFRLKMKDKLKYTPLSRAGSNVSINKVVAHVPLQVLDKPILNKIESNFDDVDCQRNNVYYHRIKIEGENNDDVDDVVGGITVKRQSFLRNPVAKLKNVFLVNKKSSTSSSSKDICDGTTSTTKKSFSVYTPVKNAEIEVLL